MVYRGRPSKACERCRSRRLKCDLKPICGQCIRADSTCLGYRDISQLRFQHETAKTMNNAVSKTNPELSYLPISIDNQARAAFFSHYVSSTCWDFLAPHFDTINGPNVFIIALEATSLAFLWHQSSSSAALQAARQRYALALRMTKSLLQSHQEAIKDTTLLTTLLLDIFEKITTSQSTDISSITRSSMRTTHLDGALTLVKLRGLDSFRDITQVKILRRLDALCVSSSVTNELRSLETFTMLRSRLGKMANGQGTMADLAIEISSTMISYGRLRRQSHNDILSKEEFFNLSIALERRLQNVEDNLPISARATVKTLSREGKRVFGIYYHEYRHQNVCATRNMLRVARLDLNASLAELYTSSANEDRVNQARAKITHLIDEIVASVPAYTTCPDCGTAHQHTPRQRTNVYLLIFPLYVVGHCRFATSEIKKWVLKELIYIAEHFNIRNAHVVAGILEGAETRDFWDIYELLGGCAFSA